MSEVILPSENKSNQNLKIEFWIKAWGWALIFNACSRFLVDTPLAAFLIEIGLGLGLFFCKRTQYVRHTLIFYSLFATLGGAILLYVSYFIYPDKFRLVYFVFSTIFFGGFLIFLIMPETIKAFGEVCVCKASPVLELKEERNIKILVRLIAVILSLQGIMGYLYSDWLRSHRLPFQGKLTLSLSLIAALGLYLFQQNFGRRLTLFIALMTFIGAIPLNFNYSTNFFGIVYTIYILLFYMGIFIFLLLPKTKAVFGK